MLPCQELWADCAPLNLPSGVHPAATWFYDESIYYANDCCELQWVHEDSSPSPHAKGEGASMMDVEYMSPDYGFLWSLDGKEMACIIFKPGKNRDGYFDNKDIIKQAITAMNICKK